MPLTLKERERRAYIEGRVEEAALFEMAVEGEARVQQDLVEQAEELVKAEEEIGKLMQQLEDKDVEIEELKDQLANTEETVNKMQIQIHEAGIDLL